MYCRNCGKEIPDNASFCPVCGQPTDKAPGTSAPDVSSTQQSTQQSEQQPKPDGYAIASLVLGILGLFILPLIGGILAVVFGNISKKNIGATTMAKAGKILGIIAIVVSLIVIVIFVLMFALVGYSIMSFY